jgi:hypothetical protein
VRDATLFGPTSDFHSSGRMILHAQTIVIARSTVNEGRVHGCKELFAVGV